MEYKQILEELEKRIAFLRRKSVSQSELNAVKADLDSLRTKVNALENAQSYNEQTINAVNQSISELTQTLSTHTTTLNDHSATLSEQASAQAELESQIATLTSNSSSQATSITQLNETLTSLIARIETLENSSGDSNGNIIGSSCNCIETFNTSLKETLKVYNKDGVYTTALIFFRCEPTARISFKGKIHISNFPTEKTYAHAIIYLNEVEYTRVDWNQTFTQDAELDFELSFFPKQEGYSLRIQFLDEYLHDSVLTTIDVELDGRNVMILNRNTDFHLHVFNGTYYLTFQDGQNGYYLEQTSLDLSAEKTPIPNHTSRGHLYRLYKQTIFYRSSWRITNTKYVFIVSSGYFTFGILTLGDTSTPDIEQGIYDVYYTNKSGDSNYYSIVAVTTTGKVKIATNSNFTSSTESDYLATLNGTPLPENYVSCVPVYDHYLHTRSSTESGGFILLDRAGHLTFLPEKHATYTIDLGIGNQPNAYLQADNTTINVYYNYCNSVIKKMLKKNSDGVFELSEDTITYRGVTEYIEGLDGISVQKIDGEYIVI